MLMGIRCSSLPSWSRLPPPRFSSMELDLVCLGASRSIVRQTSDDMVSLAHKRLFALGATGLNNALQGAT
jgi:hypothetical protein